MSLQEFFPPLVLLISVIWVIGRLPFFSLSGVHARWLQLAFLLKAGAGIVMYYLYTCYYPIRSDADTFKYFDDSKHMYDALWCNPVDFFKMLFGIGCENEHFFKTYYVKMNNWYLAYDTGLINDSRLIIRLNAVFRLFSFGNYHIHNIFLNLLSFIGLYALMRLFIQVSDSKWKSYIAAFLVPSTIFWSSGILKEAVLVFALGLFCFNFYRLIYESFRWKTCVTIILLLPVLLVVKLYVFAALVTAGTGLVLAAKWKANTIPFIISCLGFLLIVTMVGLVNPKYSFIELLVQKQHDFVDLAQRTSAKSFIETAKMDNSMWSILAELPSGLLNSLSRPWPKDIQSFLFIPPFLENILVLGLIMNALIKAQKLVPKQKTFVLFCLTFTVILFAVIGITTPIIGAIVRYKMPALPFIFFSLLLLLRMKSIDQRLEPFFAVVKKIKV